MKSAKTRKQALSTRFRKIRKISVSLVVLQIFAVLWVSPESFGQMPISGALLTLDVEERSLGLHEPVHVTVGITNVTGEEISFELNEGSKYYLTFSFTTNPSFEPSNFFNLGGTNAAVLGAPGKVVLKPGDRFSKTVLLNEWSHLANGKTLVEPHIGTRSHRSVDDGRGIPNDDLPIRTASGLAVKLIPARPLTLDIGLRNDELLQKICAGLGEQALGANTPELRTEAASTLRYIDDDMAVPFLGDIIEKGHSSLGEIAVDGLFRIHSDIAITGLIRGLKVSKDEGLKSKIVAALTDIAQESRSEQRRTRIRAGIEDGR